MHNDTDKELTTDDKSEGWEIDQDDDHFERKGGTVNIESRRSVMFFEIQWEFIQTVQKN